MTQQHCLITHLFEKVNLQRFKILKESEVSTSKGTRQPGTITQSKNGGRKT